MNREFLDAGNPKKIANAYKFILDAANINKIDDETKKHAQAMYELGRIHFKFAIIQSSHHWRQRVSRLYYASYNVSKSLTDKDVE